MTDNNALVLFNTLVVTFAGSNMHLRLQPDGTVTGVSVERGKFIRGNSVEGKIRGGRWWAEGYVELVYVFYDGSTYTYR